MSTKKIMKEIEAVEIVKSFVLPVKLTMKQEQEARDQLSVDRRKQQAEAKPMEILTGKLMQLKFQLEDYRIEHSFWFFILFLHKKEDYYSASVSYE